MQGICKKNCTILSRHPEITGRYETTRLTQRLLSLIVCVLCTCTYIALHTVG